MNELALLALQLSSIWAGVLTQVVNGYTGPVWGLYVLIQLQQEKPDLDF